MSGLYRNTDIIMQLNHPNDMWRGSDEFSALSALNHENYLMRLNDNCKRFQGTKGNPSIYANSPLKFMPLFGSKA